MNLKMLVWKDNWLDEVVASSAGVDFTVSDSNLRASDCLDFLGNWVFPSGFEIS